MIRKGDWKLIHHMDAPAQLFELGSDPDELNNLAEQRPDRVAELEIDLRKICCPEVGNARAHAFEKWQLYHLARTGSPAYWDEEKRGKT